MRAVILAGDRGQQLHPLTSEIPAAMVPVLDQPLMAHTVGLLRRQGIEDIAAVLGHQAHTVRRHFGDELTYEPEVRGEPVIVIAGDVLTDVDVAALAPGTVVRGGIAVLDAALLDQLPAVREWGERLFPALAELAVPMREVEGYCASLSSPQRLRRGVFDLLARRVRLPVSGDEVAEGLTLGEASSLDGIAMIEPPVWIGADVQIGVNARLHGPLVIGDGATIGDGAQLRGSVILPGSTVPRETILIDGVAGIVDSLR